MPENMTFGIQLLNSVPPWMTEHEVLQNSLEYVRHADDLGFEVAWVAEHNARSYGIVGNALTFVAAAAAQTSQITLGTAIIRVPMFHPLHIAEDAALVDHISRGRLYIGIGRAYDDLEFGSYGFHKDERDGRYREAEDIILQAWREHKVGYKGEHFKVPAHGVADSIELFPKPYQDPHPPIFVMVTRSDESVIKAAEHGYSVCLGQRPSWEDARRKADLWAETARDAGYDDEYIEAGMQRSGQLKFVHVAETTEQAEDEYERGMMWYLQARDNRNMYGLGAEPKPYREYLQDRVALLGSPDKLIEDLQEVRQNTGFGHVLCQFDIGGQPHGQVMSAMQLFAEKVRPHL